MKVRLLAMKNEGEKLLSDDAKFFTVESNACTYKIIQTQPLQYRLVDSTDRPEFSAYHLAEETKPALCCTNDTTIIRDLLL